jgi:hypothetical protein
MKCLAKGRQKPVSFPQAGKLCRVSQDNLMAGVLKPARLSGRRHEQLEKMAVNSRQIISDIDSNYLLLPNLVLQRNRNTTCIKAR